MQNANSPVQARRLKSKEMLQEIQRGRHEGLHIAVCAFIRERLNAERLKAEDRNEAWTLEALIYQKATLCELAALLELFEKPITDEER